jgi:hypothetical protein
LRKKQGWGWDQDGDAVPGGCLSQGGEVGWSGGSGAA